MIDYDDSTHTYSFRGRRYLSATQVVGYFSNEFDTDGEASKYAQRHGLTKEHWTEKWGETREAALLRGNRIHNLRESITLARGTEMVMGQPRRVQNIELYPERPLGRLPDGVYPEMKLWSHKWKIAGRSDMVILETERGLIQRSDNYSMVWPGRRIAHIGDYKTNRFIRQRGFPLNREATLRTMMKYPLEHLEDCDRIHYELQLPLYQFMLEEHYFEPGDRHITHFPHKLWCAPEGSADPAPVHYNLPYRKDDVTSMLTFLTNRGILL